MSASKTSLPYLKGPKAFAIVLLRFKDTAVPDIPISHLFDFVSSSGKGGLFDYWRDASYGKISLENSEVFGWFTMKYSFVEDGVDPWHSPTNKTPARNAWVAEAKRLCSQNQIDLSRFHGGIIAIVNANCDEGNVTRGWPGRDFGETTLGIGGSWGQPGWKRCNQCQSLTYTRNPDLGKCAGGETHEHGGSRDYSLAMELPNYHGIRNHRWCRKCQVLCWAGPETPTGQGTCPAGGFHDPSQSANYTIGDVRVGSILGWESDWKFCNNCCQLFYNPRPGVCPEGGGRHDSSDTRSFGLVSYYSSLNIALQGYESGRCLGLNNSWLAASPDVELGDKYDIMSAPQATQFQNGFFAPAGPSLNAPTRYKLGWLASDRVFHHSSSSSSPPPIKLLALNKPELDGYLMVLYSTNDRIFTIEYRQQDGWDQGFSKSCVLVHELRSKYATGRKGFRWCNKCQGLFSASTAVCPAGLTHDYIGSNNYRLVNNNPSHNGQKDWSSCTDCRMVWYTANDTAGSCPAKPGQGHKANPEGHFSLTFEPTLAPGQHDWKWCRKCQGLSYSKNALRGACPAGGSHEHSGSGNYILNNTVTGEGMTGFRWCRKCQTLSNATFAPCVYAGILGLLASHEYDGSGDYALAVNDTNAPGQAGWKICRKCHGLNFAQSQGRCAAGGDHDKSDPEVFTVMHGSSDQTGQNNWRCCKKCQLMYFPEFMVNIKCPAGGSHDSEGSLIYNIPHFETDRVFLVGGELHPGDVWEDASRNVKVAIKVTNLEESSVIVELGGP
ncbi:hypothetical protein H2198_004713 [Neophaeococcomyces mojaviensis]|uniref:Uncharacterized protein n=1 Tax=Neophaeococcomyces mojaviensis TaxID=3383035 RepID=A0ACC3A7U7_9EURO|nr:hypothetical protein H2198_004713 [Knufia sp. JES_112]